MPIASTLRIGSSLHIGSVAAVLLAAVGSSLAIEPPATPTPPAPAASPSQPLPPALVRQMDGGTVVEQLRAEAAQVMHRVRCDATRRLLVNTSWLPVIDKRRVFRDKAAGVVLSPAAHEALPQERKGSFEAVEIDEEFFYFTSYGSPLAYARPLDLVAQELGCKDSGFAGKRILDFGYGGIGHLRLLASVGAHVTGVEINPLLEALYSQPGDTGEVPGAGIADPKPPAGSISLVTGSWPSDPTVAQRVGGGYDLIISKNVLKNGYVHPAREIPDRQRVKLGVDDAGFLKAVATALNEGGLFMIYNICPKQREDKYIPWADGKCPFSREAIVAAGLEVLDFDVEDSVEARLQGKALGWDQGESPMDLENDCFAWYTLIRKPPK